MKKLIITALAVSVILYTANLSYSQIGIGTKTPDAMSVLDLTSDSQGFLPPRMTDVERDAIAATPTTALLIYNETTDKSNYYNGSAWQEVVDGSDQTITGEKTFKGDIIAEGRLMIPMGEISYFNYSGYSVPIPLKATGASGNDNMVKIDPTTVEFVNDMFNNTEGETATLSDTKLIYTGKTTRYFHIALSFSYTPGTTRDVFVFGVAKNGAVEDSSKIFIRTRGTGDIGSSAMHVLLKLDQYDFLEFYVGNTFVNGSSIKIKNINFVAIGM